MKNQTFILLKRNSKTHSISRYPLIHLNTNLFIIKSFCNKKLVEIKEIENNERILEAEQVIRKR